MVDLRLLGSTELTDPAGAPIPSVLTRPKRLALLTYLALEDPGALHRREKLVGLFWADSDETRARGSLSVVLHHLRRLLGEDVVVKRGREEVGVSLDALRVDVHEFERAVQSRELERAAELYRGPLLEGFHLDGAVEFSQWLENRRHRLHVHAVEVLTKLARASFAQDLTRARRWARKAAALAPCDERAHRVLMEVLERAGHPAEALRVHSTFRSRLDELEMEPSPDFRAYVARLKHPRAESAERSPEGAEKPTEEKKPSPSREVAPGTALPIAEAKPSRDWSSPGIAITAGILLLSALALALTPRLSGFLEPSSAAPEETTGIRTVAPPLGSLAVLPFQRGKGLSDDEMWLSEGLSQTLTDQLGRISGLHVASESSAGVYGDGEQPLNIVARTLGVERLISGSVGRMGDSVSIDLRMVDAGGQELWSKSYAGLLRSVFRLQAQAVQDVIAQTHVELTRGEELRLAASSEDVDPDVLRLVLRGDLHAGRLDEEALRQALRLYLEARALDQDHAPAYAGIASAYLNLASWHASVRPQNVLPLARAAAERALALDPGLARGHMVLGKIRFWFDWDWTGAERSFRRALELNPSLAPAHVAYTHFLSSRGRADEALIHGLEAVELDPLMPGAYFEAGVAADLAGRPAEAMRLYRRGLDLDPASDQGPTVIADFHYMRAGNPEDAIAFLERAQELAENAFTLGLLGYAYAVTGRESEAKAALTRLEKLRTEAHVSPVSFAYLHLGLGNHDEALNWLETAFAERDMALVWLEEAHVYGPIRDEPRFQRLLERMGFPE